MKNRSIRSLVSRMAIVGAIGLGGAAVVAQPASASLGACSSGKVCLWASANFAGSASQWSSSTGVINVNAQSRYNKSSKCATYYHNSTVIATGTPNTGWGSGLQNYTSITLTPC